MCWSVGMTLLVLALWFVKDEVLAQDSRTQVAVGLTCGQGCIPFNNNTECWCPLRRFIASRRAKQECPPGCTLRNKICICLLQVTSQPTAARATTYVCPPGFTQQYGQSKCISQLVPSCATGCVALQGQCFCPADPAVSAKYECTSGCVLQGNQCLCTYKALYLPYPQDPTNPQYFCQPDCTQSGENCFCIIPAKSRPTGPTGLTQYACQPECDLKGQLCYCVSPAQIATSPSTPSFFCKPGCALQGTYCSCTYPATIYDDPSPVYQCRPRCTLKETSCYCVSPAEIATGSAFDEPKYTCEPGCELQKTSCSCIYPAIQTQPAPRYKCPVNCGQQGTLCTCIIPADIMYSEGSNPRYVCDEGCELQGTDCTCIYPAVEYSVGPDRRCPTNCVLQGAMCSCLSPADVANPGTLQSCPAGCVVLQNVFCACMKLPDEVTGPNTRLVPSAPPRYICKPGCVLKESQCLCITPATQVYDSQGQPSWACHIGCSMYDQICYCIYPPELDNAANAVDSPGVIGSCKPGCLLLPNGACQCLVNSGRAVTRPVSGSRSAQAGLACGQGCFPYKNDTECWCPVAGRAHGT